MNNATKTAIIVLASMAAGAALGVLFAPEEGAETRKKIVKRGQKVAGIIEESMHDGLESLEELKATLHQQLHKINDQIAKQKA